MNGNASQSRCRVLTGLGLLIMNFSGWASPLTWFPGPPLYWPLSSAATTVVPGLGNVVIGGDSGYYPLSLAVTNASWAPMPSLGSVAIATGAVANGDFIIVY